MRSIELSARGRIATVAVLSLITGVLVLTATADVAQAAVTTPSPDSTVSGVVPITEGRGGNNGSSLFGGACSGAYTRIEVHQLDEVGDPVAEVLNHTHSTPAGQSNQPVTVTWDTVGLPNGDYGIRSITADVSASLFSCGSVQSEVTRSDLVVTVENAVVAVPDLPATHISGEPLTVGVSTEVEATGAPLADQPFTVVLPGVGEQTATSGPDGTAAVTFALPHLPAGTLEVVTVTDGDDLAFAGRTASDDVVLQPRPTEMTWTGDLRGDPGETVRLEGRLTDATPGSDLEGEPVAGADVVVSVADGSLDAVTNADGRASVDAALAGHPRYEDAGADFAGDDLWGPSERTIVFIIGDDAAIESPTEHSIIGGLLRLLNGILDHPSGLLGTTLTLVDSALPGLDLDDQALIGLTVDELDALLDSMLDATIDLGGLTPLADTVDVVLDAALDALVAVPEVGTLIDSLRYEWRSVYVAPDGARIRHTYEAVMGVPTALDLDGDELADVVANLTVVPTTGSINGGELPVIPTLKVHRLPNAPRTLPLSLQAVIDGGGLFSVGGEDGSMRFGYDTRTSDAPSSFEARLAVGAGGFDIDLATRDAQALAVTGALVGGDTELPFGTFVEPGAPSFDEPVAADGVGPGEMRFGLGFDPAPERARIGLGLGGDGADVAARISTDAPSEVGVDFVQDTGGDEVFTVGGLIDAVDGDVALVLGGGGGASGDLGPDLALELEAAGGLDRLALQARGLAGGDITDDLLLSLTDVPDAVSFGVAGDGGIGLSASAPIGVLEAGFASGGPIAQLGDEAYLHMSSDEDLESVALRLLGVESLSADVGENLSLELDMAPTPLRAKVDSDGLGLDAKIYDAPEHLALGLSADGAFEIVGSSPIDLITIQISDDSGALLGATEVDVRIEEIPGRLSVGLVGESVSFDAGGDSIGLLEMSASSGTPAVLPAGQDGLLLTLTEDEFAMTARIHGLRSITADMDLGAPSFMIDTTASSVFALDLDVDGIAVSGTIDHLVPDMRMEVVADDEGELAGLLYTAAEPTNSISFEIPGFASFSASDPLPTRMELAMGDVMLVSASEHFTLDLDAEIEGVTATITDLRVRHMEFGGALEGGDEDTIPMYFNTTEVSDECPEGCTYTLPSGTLALGPVDVGLDVTIRFTPNGFAANDATVQFLISGSIIPSVSNAGQTGTIHCKPAPSGTTLVADSIIDISMTNALCANSADLADLRVEGLDAPASSEVGEDVVHEFAVVNAGPAPASDVRIQASHHGELGDPGVSCSADGVPSTDVGVAVCEWPGPTAVDAARSMVLSWVVDGSTPDGATVTVDYEGSSASAGTTVNATATTAVHGSIAAMDITSVAAPTMVVAGTDDVLHRLEARNLGPSTAQDMRITADPDGDLDDPTVTCSEGGEVEGAGCVWPGDSPVDAERWAELAWAVPHGTPDGTLSVDYVVSSGAPAADATATAVTAIVAALADLELSVVDAPEEVEQGADLVHVVQVLNTGPSAAESVRILADHGPELGAPSVICSSGGTATTFAEIGRARCVWSGETPVDGERTMELRWVVAEDAPAGTVAAVDHRATSDTPGARPTASTSTEVVEVEDQAPTP